MSVSEIRVKQIRVNQGLGVYPNPQLCVMIFELSCAAAFFGFAALKSTRSGTMCWK